MEMTPAEYASCYRKALGFPSQSAAKDFLAAKDIAPKIDYDYIENLNDRLCGIFKRLNEVVAGRLEMEKLGLFLQNSIHKKYSEIVKNNLIGRMNNQGRRPEAVLFSWLRGSATGEFFEPFLTKIFCGKNGKLKKIGEDDVADPDTFKRAPTADYLAVAAKRRIRIEVQAGFQGINDVKQHKVLEAVRIFREKGEATICVHFDIYNGQVAFINLSAIKEDDSHWITRQQMEGQTVFNIDQNYFKWRLMDQPPTIKTLELFS
jgi:hypothetical protein